MLGLYVTDVGEMLPALEEPAELPFVVIRAKCLRSVGKCHGNSPFNPIPRVVADAATIAVAAMSFTINIIMIVLVL